MKKILTYCSVIGDGTSWYRGAGPLNALRRQFSDEVQVHYTDARAEWFHLTGADLVFMQRPCTEEHFRFAKMVKNANLPLWIDYDDLITNLTPENSLHHFYEECKPVIPKIVELADFISVSTEGLVSAFSTKAVKPVVIPNAWNDWLIPSLRPAVARAGKKILWRGCLGHVKDLFDAAEDIFSLANKHPDWSWTFVGWRPWYFDVKEYADRFHFVNGMGLIEYFHWLKSQEFNVAIVPLADTPFNRAKSNAAWLETTQAGAVAVAPDWEEWKRPGILRHRGDFPAMIESAMNGFDLKARWKESQDFIFSNRLLSSVNLLHRIEIVRQLTK